MAILTPLCRWLFLITVSQLVSMLALSVSADIYIVHMDLSTMPKAFSGHHSWFSATLSSISDTISDTSTERNIPAATNLIYTYNHVINGFSASLSPTELNALKNSPGYISSIRDIPLTLHTTHTSQFLGLNPATGAWPASNYGKGVIVGVVDTGIWPESDSFKDDGMEEIPSRWKGECESGTQFNSSMCNKKLIGARFFNKGLVAHNPNMTIAVNSTRDTDGHGTHTSSTAAGNYVEGASFFGYAKGTARGMAPRSHVAMYKAFWEEGAYTSDFLAAIDQAMVDGVDVLSLSFGLDEVALYQDPIAIATFAATEKGIFVSSSAGNRGPWFGTLHNGTPWLLNVAAGSIDREFERIVSLGNGVSVTGQTLYPGNSTVNQVPLVFMNTCESVKNLKRVRHSIVVCQDRNDSLGYQVNNVGSANATAGIFISNSSVLELFLENSFPAVFISLENGPAILEYIKTNSDPRASLEFQRTIVGTKPAPTVSSYSSRGPSASCPSVLKPDIMAPGTLVLASWARSSSVGELGTQKLYSNFNIISGTSMSCPHAAGVAALLKGVHPEWSPAAIRSAMMTTADSIDNNLNPIKDTGDGNQPASPLAMGAGHLNPNKALDPGLIYDATSEDYVRLLCALNYTNDQIKVITRSSASNCSNPSLDLNYPSFIAFFNANDSNQDTQVVREFQRTVTNVGDGMSTYTAKLTSMDGFQLNVMPEKLAFNHKYDKLSYKLTIQGPRGMKKNAVHGSLSWIDVEGKHVVRSPIVATSFSSEPLAGQG